MVISKKVQIVALLAGAVLLAAYGIGSLMSGSTLTSDLLTITRANNLIETQDENGHIVRIEANDTQRTTYDMNYSKTGKLLKVLRRYTADPTKTNPTHINTDLGTAVTYLSNKAEYHYIARVVMYQPAQPIAPNAGEVRLAGWNIYGSNGNVDTTVVIYGTLKKVVQPNGKVQIFLENGEQQMFDAEGKIILHLLNDTVRTTLRFSYDQATMIAIEQASYVPDESRVLYNLSNLTAQIFLPNGEVRNYAITVHQSADTAMPNTSNEEEVLVRWHNENTGLYTSIIGTQNSGSNETDPTHKSAPKVVEPVIIRDQDNRIIEYSLEGEGVHHFNWEDRTARFQSTNGSTLRYWSNIEENSAFEATYKKLIVENVYGIPTSTEESFTGANGQKVTLTMQEPRLTETILSLTDPALSEYQGNNYELFTAAIDLARERGATKLIIPTGTYNFYVPDSVNVFQPAINFTRLNDIVIDGQGSTFRFHNIRDGVVIRQSDKVVLKDLNIDWGIPIAFPATIEHENSVDYVHIKDDPAYPIDPNNPPSLSIISPFDIENKTWSSESLAFYDSLTFAADPMKILEYVGLQNGVHRYKYNRNKGSIQRTPGGTPVIATRRLRKAALLLTAGASNIQIDNVHIYAAPGEGFLLRQAGKSISIRNSSVSKNPNDPSRLISTAADGLHAVANGGEVLIENTLFTGMGDDAINLRGQLSDLSYVVNPVTMIIPKRDFSLDVGNTLEFFDPNTFESLGTANVSYVANPTGCGASCVYGFVLDTELPNVKDDSTYVNISNSTSKFIVRNNTMRNHRARAILAITSDGLIEGNTIFDLTTGGIFLGADSDFFHEGPGARNVIVRDNIIESVGFGTFDNEHNYFGSTLTAPLIIKAGVPTDEKFSRNNPVHTLLIENNIVRTAYGVGAFISSATNVIVRDNVFEDLHNKPLASDTQMNGSVMITNSKNVQFINNEVDGAVFADPRTTENILVQ